MPYGIKSSDDRCHGIEKYQTEPNNEDGILLSESLSGSDAVDVLSCSFVVMRANELANGKLQHTSDKGNDAKPDKIGHAYGTLDY